MLCAVVGAVEKLSGLEFLVAAVAGGVFDDGDELLETVFIERLKRATDFQVLFQHFH